MKIFKDKELKEEVQLLDLGIVRAGESKRYSYYLLNDSAAYLIDLVYKVIHPEVKILKAPNAIKAKEAEEIIVEWNPAVTLKEGLKTNLEITGSELWS